MDADANADADEGRCSEVVGIVIEAPSPVILG